MHHKNGIQLFFACVRRLVPEFGWYFQPQKVWRFFKERGVESERGQRNIFPASGQRATAQTTTAVLPNSSRSSATTTVLQQPCEWKCAVKRAGKSLRSALPCQLPVARVCRGGCQDRRGGFFCTAVLKQSAKCIKSLKAHTHMMQGLQTQAHKREQASTPSADKYEGPRGT